MSVLSQPGTESGRFATRSLGILWLLLALLAALPVFWLGFEGLAKEWAQPQHRLKPLVPVLSLLMFLHILRTSPPLPAPDDIRWPGFLLVAGALALALLGNLVWVDDFVFIAMIVWGAGLVILGFGLRQALPFWPAIGSLFLMLPLPRFVYWPIHTALERIAVTLGLELARLGGATGKLEGQLLDFGVLTLPVEEAGASLLNFLPVMLVCFFFSAIMRGPLWMRLVPLLLAVPVVVLLTALRIGLLGLLAIGPGPETALAMLHASEGWAFLLLCALVLLLPPALLHRARAPSVSVRASSPGGRRAALSAPSLAAAAALTACLSLPMLVGLARPAGEIVRDTFHYFPPDRAGWRGTFSAIDERTARTLGASDYVNIDFWHADERASVNFWSAYYYEQNADEYAIHSPMDCLPGDGWNFLSFRRINLRPVSLEGRALPVNRALISRDGVEAVMVYWFEGRGRSIADERLARLMAKFDAVLMGRTDGALVRYVTMVQPGETEAEAEARLLRLLENTVGLLRRFIPE